MVLCVPNCSGRGQLDLEDEGVLFIGNVGDHLPDDPTPHHRRLESSHFTAVTIADASPVPEITCSFNRTVGMARD
jgi:hypothetical protein